jgi:hypothetical protein
MVTVLVIVVIVLAAGECLLLGALAEAYRDIAQLREHVGAVDASEPIDVTALRGACATDLGLAAEVETVPSALAIFLDRRCVTCAAILRSLDGAPPLNVWVTAMAGTEAEAIEWLESEGVSSAAIESGRIRPALFSDVVARVGVTVTPFAIRLENGLVVEGMAIPSVRRFYALIPNPERIRAIPTHRPEEAIA